MLGDTIVPTAGACFGQSFVLSLLVQEAVLAILENGQYSSPSARRWLWYPKQRKYQSLSQARAKAMSHISLIPASARTLHAHRASLFCPACPRFFFSFSRCKSQEVSWHLVQEEALAITPAACTYPSTLAVLQERKFLGIWCFQEEGLMGTFSLAIDLGKCPNSPTSLCLSGRVVLGPVATSVSSTVSFKCISKMLTRY